MKEKEIWIKNVEWMLRLKRCGRTRWQWAEGLNKVGVMLAGFSSLRWFGTPCQGTNGAANQASGKLLNSSYRSHLMQVSGHQETHKPQTKDKSCRADMSGLLDAPLARLHDVAPLFSGCASPLRAARIFSATYLQAANTKTHNMTPSLEASALIVK